MQSAPAVSHSFPDGSDHGPGSTIQRLGARLGQVAEQVRDEASTVIYRLDQALSAWVEREANHIYNTFSTRAQNDLRRYATKAVPYIVLLYVLVGLAMVFSALTFFKLVQQPALAGTAVPSHAARPPTTAPVAFVYPTTPMATRNIAEHPVPLAGETSTAAQPICRA
jgi:hypothetical protein